MPERGDSGKLPRSNSLEQKKQILGDKGMEHEVSPDLKGARVETLEQIKARHQAQTADTRITPLPTFEDAMMEAEEGVGNDGARQEAVALDFAESAPKEESFGRAVEPTASIVLEEDDLDDIDPHATRMAGSAPDAEAGNSLEIAPESEIRIDISDKDFRKLTEALELLRTESDTGIRLKKNFNENLADYDRIIYKEIGVAGSLRRAMEVYLLPALTEDRVRMLEHSDSKRDPKGKLFRILLDAVTGRSEYSQEINGKDREYFEKRLDGLRRIHDLVQLLKFEKKAKERQAYAQRGKKEEKTPPKKGFWKNFFGPK